jgi:rare lipoprotein A
MKRKPIAYSTFFKCLLPLFFLLSISFIPVLKAQKDDNNSVIEDVKDTGVDFKKPRVYYGTASYYADIFNGRQTANGEKYNHSIPSAACNILPLGTWIRVTNLKNRRTVIVRINDRLHPRMKRIVDLNKDSAIKLGYVSKGLEEVKVEVLGVKKPIEAK